MRYKGNKDIYALEDQPMKAGGEGAIYAISNHPDKVAKIYHADRLSSELEDKIIFMANNPPSQNVLDQIAWPLDVVRNAMGDFVGFVMPKLEIDTDLKAIYAYPPNPKIPITCEQKVIVALNICIVISAIHKAGYVFGDFNPLNIGINLKTGHVAFLDTDSYHITDPQSGKLYRCGVCLDGYAAPELIQQCKGTDFLSAPLPTFTQETDRFALAIHIFKLLMNGYTPFNGIKEGESASQASPGVGNLAIERDNYCFKPGNKPQSAATPNMSCLTPDLQYLFKKTFLGGAQNPAQRATANEWYNALKEYKDNLVQCKSNPAHHYYVNNSSCPYCAADANYTQSMSTPTVGLHTMFGGSPNQFNFGTPVNVPPTGRTQTSNYAHQTNVSQTQIKKKQKQAANKSKGKTVGRVLCWIFFFPVMLLITACKSKLPLLVKILIVPTLLQCCLYYFGFIVSCGTFALDYFNIVEVEQLANKIEDFFNEVFDDDSPSYYGGSSTYSDDDDNIASTTANNGEYVDGKFKYTKNETGYTVAGIAGYKHKLSGDVVIPSSFNGKAVTEIAPNGFNGCSQMVSVVVPDSITTIHEGAFKGCTSLQSITLPFVGKSINAEAYESVFGFIFGYECVYVEMDYSGLSRAYNDKPVSIVGETWQLTWQEEYDRTRAYYYYYIPSSIRNVTITNQSNISAYAFNGCSNITSIKYTSNKGDKTIIGEAAFQDCNNLTFDGDDNGCLEVPDNVIEIGEYAFAGCMNITEIVVPSSVRSIGCAAFMGCNAVEKITVPFIGKSASAQNFEAVLGYIFGYEAVEKEMEYSGDSIAYNDEPIAIPGQLWQFTWQKEYDRTRIYYYYFIPLTLNEVIVTQQTTIPAYSFNGCSNITNIEFTSMKEKGAVIGEAAFQNCSSLKFGGDAGDTLQITDAVTEIGAYAYNGCSNIVNVIIPQSVRKIGFGAFMGCNNIRSMELPFVGKAEDATLYESVLGYIFGYEIVEKRMDSSPAYDTVYNDKPVSIVGETWQYTFQEDYDRTRYYFYYYIPSSLETVIITKQVKIPAYAFNGCSSIKSIVLPKGAINGEYAFQDCKAKVTEADT